jgi:ubiquinol-cytochrome c reductase cytochrome b subunit
VTRWLLRWLDQRLGTNRFVRSATAKVFPDHWSFLFGEIAMYCFVILVLTGTYLTFFFSPSAKEVTYHGSYVPLQGVPMTEAFRSTLRLSFDVRAGLVFRQVHHWAALVFVGAIVVHLCRVFFTGAFRRPREVNWIVGVTLLVLVIVNGFFGYSLPDDLLSGTGLRIMYSVALAIPVVGTWLAFLLFGGEFPADDITSRMYVLHILVLPALIATLMGVHLAIVWRQKHTQFPGPGRTEDNVVGSPLWPSYAAKSAGLLCVLLAVLCLLGGLAQINPIWLYGPFRPSSVTTAAQPDWYMGWLEGALRLFPGWRPSIFGYEVSELFVPAVLLPGITFGMLYAWPFVEPRLTGDRSVHHLLDRPRDHPHRTALGTGVLTFYVVLFVAGSQDVLAQHLGLGIPTVTWTLRVLGVVLPLAVAVVTARLCRGLQAADALDEQKAALRSRLLAGEPAAPEAEARPATVGRTLGGLIVALAALLGRRRQRAHR